MQREVSDKESNQEAIRYAGPCTPTAEKGISCFEQKEGVYSYDTRPRRMRPTKEQYDAYQQAFDYFNSMLFENSLPYCMLSFCRRRSSSHTLYTTGQWQKKAGSATPEISLNIQQMVTGGPIEVMAALVRQMVHMWQERYGQPSRKGYYNREWAGKMEAIGLMPSATGLPGGRRTGQTIRLYIEAKGPFARAFREMPDGCLLPFRPTAFEGEKSRRNSDKVRYQCVGCGTKVWGKSGLGLVCECGKVFTDETGDLKAGLGERVYRILAEQYGY